MGQVLFFNMTKGTALMTLNERQPAIEIKPLPGTVPYTPNYNSTTEIKRTAEPPHRDEFGAEDTIHYELNGGDLGTVKVTIKVDQETYPTSGDLLVYLFLKAVIVMPAEDAKPFLGKNGETIEVAPSSPNLI
jgi:hypothetical protein